MAKLKTDLTGKHIESFVVIKDGIRRNKKIYCLCKCECGNIVEIRKDNLNGHRNTKNCGCKPSQYLHGLTHHRLHTIWAMMKQRCMNPKHRSYRNYGAKGIIVCDEWVSDFKAFYDWSTKNGYKEGLTLDRIDYNGNYEPNNCRWFTYKQQGNNRRNNRLLTYNGETHTMSQWCDITGLSKATIYGRLKSGWSIERTLTTPNRQYFETFK